MAVFRRALAHAVQWRRCLLVPIALCAALAAHAQQGAYEKAGQAFAALQAADPSGMPRLSEARAAAVLRTLTDSRRFPPNQAALPEVSDICDRAQSTIVAYWLFGAMRHGEIVASVVGDNAARYQEELARLQVFQAHCVARQIPLAEAALRDLDPRVKGQLRLGGLQRGRMAVLQVYAALGTALQDPRFKRDYADALLGALAETAAVHASALTPESRKMPLQLARAQASSAKGARRAQWKRIAQAMGSGTCAGLCALGEAKSR